MFIDERTVYRRLRRAARRINGAAPEPDCFAWHRYRSVGGQRLVRLESADGVLVEVQFVIDSAAKGGFALKRLKCATPCIPRRDQRTAHRYGNHDSEPDLVIEPLERLDGRWQEFQIWLRGLTDRDRQGITVCRHFHGDYETGLLATDRYGKILIVEVSDAHRRRGIATRMRQAMVDAGFPVYDDWANMRDEGEAWARSWAKRDKGG